MLPIFLNYVFCFDQIFLLSYILIFLKFIGLWRRVNDYTLYRHLYISGEYKIFMTSFWAFFGAATMNENEELCLNLIQQKGTNDIPYIGHGFTSTLCNWICSTIMWMAKYQQFCARSSNNFWLYMYPIHNVTRSRDPLLRFHFLVFVTNTKKKNYS